MISLKQLLIEDDVKIYLKKGEKPPKGKTLKKGNRGGAYYLMSPKDYKNRVKQFQQKKDAFVPNDEWDYEVEYQTYSGKKKTKATSSGTMRHKVKNIEVAKKKLIDNIKSVAIPGTIKIVKFEKTKIPGATRG